MVYMHIKIVVVEDNQNGMSSFLALTSVSNTTSSELAAMRRPMSTSNVLDSTTAATQTLRFDHVSARSLLSSSAAAPKDLFLKLSSSPSSVPSVVAGIGSCLHTIDLCR
mmetsp:Transcript_40461/g.91014  ORF Transcript_40461/g.91014 Transcript_40461/m.91014 type:complete len:109 (-) Transcript_40461:13-339(-)